MSDIIYTIAYYVGMAVSVYAIWLVFKYVCECVCEVYRLYRPKKTTKVKA